jgi:UDPglucose 6-dehydrogenase
MNTRVGFAGMTHLGLNSAVAAAEKGCAVVCYDPDVAIISELASGSVAIVEPDLPESLSRNRDCIHFTSDPGDLRSCNVVYVAPDVATDDEGRSDLNKPNDFLAIVMKTVDRKTVIVMLSQVPPGYTRSHMKPGMALFYQVETLIFGRAQERALYPERIIVGCADPAQPLPVHYRRFLELFNCQILMMRFESAELAKIAINCFLVSQITTTNVLAELCENIGADWSEIAPSLRLDKRIGPHAYLKPGLGIAGGNLERDMMSVIRMAETHCTDYTAIDAALSNSKLRKRKVADMILSVINSTKSGNAPVVAMLGLAYKENTHSTKNAASILTLDMLAGVRIHAYDPAVDGRSLKFDNLQVCDSWQQAVDGSDIVAIMTPWPEFENIDLSAMAKLMRGKFLIDPYALFTATAARDVGLSYATLGSALADECR